MQGSKNKIYATLVICGALVISIWLLSKTPITASIPENANTVSVEPRKQIDTTTDWKNILVATNPNAQTTSVVPKDTSSTFDDTTLTAQMAKDFFGQYLNIANQGQVTPDEANQIAQNTLASPAYTSVSGAVYVATNLQVNQKTDTDTVRVYNQTLTQKLKSRTPKTAVDPVAVVSDAMNTNNEAELSQLDPLIANIQGIESDLVGMSVPKDAVTVHLGLMNAYSNLLASIEAMRVAFSDPVRAFSGSGSYVQRVTDLSTALTNINNYFSQKLAN